MGVLITNTDEKCSVVTVVYDNLKVDGSLTLVIHPNLHKRHAYQCTPDDKIESSNTDLVISRDSTSVRFGEYDNMRSKGRVVISDKASVAFNEDIGDGLGLLYDIKDNAGVVIVNTAKDDLGVGSHGVLVLAPNFTLAQDKEYTPVLSMNRSGYTKITPDDNGGVCNIHVKSSMIINHCVHLDKVDPLGGWFFGHHSDK